MSNEQTTTVQSYGQERYEIFDALSTAGSVVATETSAESTLQVIEDLLDQGCKNISVRIQWDRNPELKPAQPVYDAYGNRIR